MTSSATDRFHGSARAAARRGAVATGAGGVAALGFGAVATAFPLAIGVVVLVPLVVLVPIVTVLIVTMADGVALPLLLAHLTTTTVNIGVLAATIVALPAVIWRATANPGVVRFAAALVVLVVPGVVIAHFALPSDQLLSGVRYFVPPVFAAVLASTLSDRALRLVLKFVTVLMVFSALAAGVETALGSDGLLRLTGLAYGTSIRNIGSALRAPGTFATNFNLGSYAAVVAVVALLWWGTLENARRDVVWRMVALLAAVTALLLSTYRTGVILLVVSVVAVVFLGGDAVKRWVKVLVAFIGLGVAIGFVAVGLGSSQSFFERIAVWKLLFAGPVELLGRGIGFSGAASGAADSARSIFTDNYYISLWLQFGIPGLVIIVMLLAVPFVLFRMGRRGNRKAAVAVALMVGTLVAFFFVELWEYTSTMALIAVVLGASVSRHKRTVVRTGSRTRLLSEPERTPS